MEKVKNYFVSFSLAGAKGLVYGNLDYACAEMDRHNLTHIKEQIEEKPEYEGLTAVVLFWREYKITEPEVQLSAATIAELNEWGEWL